MEKVWKEDCIGEGTSCSYVRPTHLYGMQVVCRYILKIARAIVILSYCDVVVLFLYAFLLEGRKL